MTVMIQVRNVSDTMHRRLKARAALAGMSMSEYLLNELSYLAERPTIEELRAVLSSRAAAKPSVTPAKAVRAERDGG